MKKYLVVLLAIAMMIATCACAPTTPASSVGESKTSKVEEISSEASESTEPKELLVSRWGGATADYQKEMVKKYTAATITIDDVDYNDMKAKQLLSFQSEKGTKGNYDVVWVNASWVTEYVKAGYIMSIDELVETCEVDLSIYDPNLVDSVTFDGKVYGVPTFLQCVIGAYDKTVFQAENIKVPTNFDEIVAAAKTLKEKGTGIAIAAGQTSGAYTLWSELLYSAGKTFVNNGELTINNDDCIAATQRYKQLVDYSCDGALGWANDGVSNALAAGVAPMGCVMSGTASILHDANTSVVADKIDYFPLYGYESSSSANLTYWVWAIPKNCADPEAAMEYIKWLCSYDIEKEQTLAVKSISAITSLAEDNEIMGSVPYAGVVMEMFANGKPDPRTASFDALKGDMTILLSNVANGGDPEALLNELQTKHSVNDWK